MAPVAVTEGAATWHVLIWVWTYGGVILAASLVLACFNPARNQYGNAVSIIPEVLAAVMCFVCWMVLIMAWAFFYDPVNHQIPDALHAISGGAPPTYSTILYNAGYVVLMIGLGFTALINNFNAGRIREGRRQFSKTSKAYHTARNYWDEPPKKKRGYG
jgi:hypothetical protein